MTASFSDLGGDSGPIKLWMVLSLDPLLCCFALLGCRNLVVAYSLRSVEVKAASVRLFCPSARRPHRCFEAAIAIKNKGRPGCSYLCGSLSHLDGKHCFHFVARKSPLRLSERCDREETHISVYLCFASRFWLRRSAIAHNPTTYFWNEFFQWAGGRTQCRQML